MGSLNISRGLPATIVLLSLFLLRIHNSKAFNGSNLPPARTPQGKAQVQPYVGINGRSHAALGYYSSIIKVPTESLSFDKKHLDAARPLHLARKAIGDNRSHQAEKIYAAQLEKLKSAPLEAMDIPAFAATTLLMALHHQRHNKDARKARAVFNYFFKVANDYYVADGRSAHSPQSTSLSHASHASAGHAHTHDDGSECFCMGSVDCGEKCTARVLQAFALFESKNSLMPKSRFLIRRAVEYDPSVASLLRWKIFQEGGAGASGLATA
eukprot:CAMPEP_0182463930 /NCGR_PEP_ID=MMETSP1319-20130603/8103_1 /TAXON_ID=172717 /ORGANISM="Bolidomonas pacifica, Strain RCC208" /LENGTH=267 /DNA_ID=CAMNT_0024663525 /DNA_START=27 /DNA_END=830 /DNA_ORIENTATION=+